MLRDQVVGITPSDFRVLKIPDEKRSSDSTRERERERERERKKETRAWATIATTGPR